MVNLRYEPRAVSLNPHYVHIENDYVPWTPLKKPVRQSTVALVTMGGLHLPNQKPFEDVDNHGDTTFRELPRALRTGGYLVAHTHYDHKWVMEDVNCLLPLDIFTELEMHGVIRKLAETHYAFMGSVPNPLRLIADTAPEMAKQMRNRSIDVCVLAAT